MNSPFREWAIELQVRNIRRNMAELTNAIPQPGRVPTISEDISLWKTFPKLTDYRIIAEPTNAYNCVGWTVSRQNPTHIWPPDIFPGDPYRAMDLFYEFLRLTRSHQPASDPRRRAVAVFEKHHLPSHVALRAETGDAWESKIGRRWCIRHDLRELEGDHYGELLHYYT
jgi:hypothetical protein